MLRIALAPLDSTVYHVINRGVGRQELFFNDSDHAAFELVIGEDSSDDWIAITCKSLVLESIIRLPEKKLK